MNFGIPALVAILGVAAVIVVGWLWRHFLSTEARWERRRRRSNTRVSSTAKRPMVRFSVRMKKGKE